MVIWAVISIVIWEALVESLGQSLGAIIWVSERCWSLLLWDSSNHHTNGDVVVIRWILLLISVFLQDRVEGVIANDLSETLKSNGLNLVKVVGWGNLKSNGFNFIDWDIDWHRVSLKVILGTSLNKAVGSWGSGVWSGLFVRGLDHLSVSLVMLVVVLLSLLMRVMLLMLVSLNEE